MLVVAKNSLIILMKSFRKNTLGKGFVGEMMIGSLPTILLQIFCKIILKSCDIVLNIIEPNKKTRKQDWLNKSVIKPYAAGG